MNDPTAVNTPQSIYIEDKKSAFIKGVQKVLAFNDSGVSLQTVLGGLLINGSGLKVDKLDVTDGTLLITGTIHSVKYQSVSKNFLQKLFR